MIAPGFGEPKTRAVAGGVAQKFRPQKQTRSAMPTESKPSEVTQAAQEHAARRHQRIANALGVGGEYAGLVRDAVEAAFMAGAVWQSERDLVRFAIVRSDIGAA